MLKTSGCCRYSENRPEKTKRQRAQSGDREAPGKACAVSMETGDPQHCRVTGHRSQTASVSRVLRSPCRAASEGDHPKRKAASGVREEAKGARSTRRVWPEQTGRQAALVPIR